MRRWIHHVIVPHAISHSIAHCVWMSMCLMIEVGIQKSLSMSSCWVIIHLVSHMLWHLAHKMASVMRIIIVVGNKRSLVLTRLLITVKIIFKIPLPNSKNNVLTCYKMMIAKNLSLFKHFKITT